MKQLHLVLVCHAELGLDGTWQDYDAVQPQVDRMLEKRRFLLDRRARGANP